MARPEKVAVVEEIRAKLAESDATVLTEYRGLTVQLAELRASLRVTGTEYKVFKNTLARRAVADSGLDGVAAMFEGPSRSPLCEATRQARPRRCATSAATTRRSC